MQGVNGLNSVCHVCSFVAKLQQQTYSARQACVLAAVLQLLMSARWMDGDYEPLFPGSSPGKKTNKQSHHVSGSFEANEA